MIDEEKRVLREMVSIYCRKKEGNASLCPDCRALISYAEHRLDLCPHGNAKPSCRHCRIHCYSPGMRARVRAVMRYSGPRMLLLHPLSVISWLRHM